MAALLQASLSSGGVPAILVATPTPVSSTAGQPATIAVAAYGQGTLSYQWYRQPAGTSGFTALADGAAYTGSATAVLQVNAATAPMNGDQFQCVVTNAQGSAQSAALPLNVTSYGTSTLAGWPYVSGAKDGLGWNARFNAPNGIAVDSGGNVFVADTNNEVIRKVTPQGQVTLFAGAFGTSGLTDGQGTSARFNGPAFVAIDASNNLYVADSGNYVIRKIQPNGQV